MIWNIKITTIAGLYNATKTLTVNLQPWYCQMLHRWEKKLEFHCPIAKTQQISVIK
jgi:hypothetical protein